MAADPAEWGLTLREQETLTTVLRVGNSADAAPAMGVSVRTIEAHFASVRRKSGAGSMHTLLAWDRHLRGDPALVLSDVSVYPRAGYVYRVYQDGRRTYEAPMSVIRGLGMAAFERGIERANRGDVQRLRATALREHVKARLAEGWKLTAIAHEAGVTDQRVRQLKRELAA